VSNDQKRIGPEMERPSVERAQHHCKSERERFYNMSLSKRCIERSPTKSSAFCRPPFILFSSFVLLLLFVTEIMMYYPPLIIVSIPLLLPSGYSFSVPRKALAGIWKLNILDDYSDSFALLNSATDDSTVVLRVLEDGTFQQCNDEDDDDDRSFNTWKGLWDFREDDSEIQLALDRGCTIQDVLFHGKVRRSSDNEAEAEQNSGCIQIKQGKVSAGKFMYPPDHRNFFDQPLAVSETVGSFSAHQVMGFATFLNDLEKPEPPPRQFDRADFYNRTFSLTVTPIEYKLRSDGAENDEIRNLPVDIRAMRIEFHTNNTFTCRATNKILRGKFEITDDDALYFHVSRFGAGKSAPGSVYSEGIGLTHEDERTYVGSITRQPNNDEAAVSHLQVQGTVLFGADLGSDARPEPVGTFLLRLINDTDTVDEYLDEEDRDLFDSVFE